MMLEKGYQPPITCSHGYVKRSGVKVRRMKLLECKDCGFTVGVIGPQLPEPAEEGGVAAWSIHSPHDSATQTPLSSAALWLADQLDGLERACMPPESWIRVWHEWV